MINNRPRGVFQNKNAANVQLASLKPVNLSGINLNDNVFGKQVQRQHLSNIANKVDSENLITLASLKSINENDELIGNKALSKASGSTLENFDKKSLKNINLNGHGSPKEPSPPKLNTRQSLRPLDLRDISNKLTTNNNQENRDLLNQPIQIQQSNDESKKLRSKNDDILVDISEEDEDVINEPIQNPGNRLNSQQVPCNDLVDSKQPEQHHDTLIQKQQSVLSRIPRLSLRFSNLPVQPKKENVNIINNGNNKLVKNGGALKSESTRFNLAKIIEVESSKLKEDSKPDIEDIDNSSSRDAVFLVCDVAKDIYDYMFKLEEDQSVKENYLRDQRILTPKVRQRLINWCIEINSQLKLLPETLYITIAIIDRFFEKFVVEQQSQVQLFASAATLIASKYEEIYPPEVRDLVYLTQSAYSRRDILRAEMFVLKSLEFDLGKPIPLAFLRRFSKAAHCNLKMHSIAKYLMELSLTEYECCHWKPSLLAAAALFSSLFIVAAHKTENITTSLSSGPRSCATRTSLAPLSLASSGGNSSKCNTNSLASQSATSSIGRLTRSGIAHSTVTRIIDSTWTHQMIHYTRYDREQLYGPSSVLCKILRRSQKNPLSFYCVKKLAVEVAKWLELRSPKVDDLIKVGELYNYN